MLRDLLRLFQYLKIHFKQCVLILIAVTSLTVSTLLILTSNSQLFDGRGIMSTTTRPNTIPKLTNEQISTLELLENSSETMRRTSMEKYLSIILQNQIANIQGRSCQEPNLECGFPEVCGAGCQIHHRIACLILSYATNLPLIPFVDYQYDGWAPSYLGNWSHVFRPVWSNCSSSHRNTFKWSWAPWSIITDEIGGRWISGPGKRQAIPWGLNLGIPIDTKLVDILEIQNLDPFRWIVGQFAKYAMSYNDEFLKQIKEWKEQVGFFDNMNIVGLQVRRTDKPTEAIGSHHEIQEYMKVVQSYFANSTSTQERAIYIASDDTLVLALAKKLYPSWKFIGFESNLSTLDKRGEGLFEIMRDIAILADCNHIVCGLSSNICRLLLEILSFKHLDSINMLTSLDGVYNYPLLGYNSIGIKVLKTE